MVLDPCIGLWSSISSENTSGISDRTSILTGYGSPLINEIYPEPSIDLNGDGMINTSDEFIELYNPMPGAVDLSNWTLSDNYDSFRIASLVLGPGAHVVMWRNETLLKLGRDDIVVLKDRAGSTMDSLEWNSLQTGISLQRSPDGGDLIRKVFDPTPGSENTGIPRVLINEVMIDPDGANLGNQWIELFNIGREENLRGYTLTNREGVLVSFDELRIPGQGRLVVFLGNPLEEVIVPYDALIIFAAQTSAMYTNGDDLVLKDNDGRVVDHLAWGSSSHVGAPDEGYEEIVWTGRYWDAMNGSMSASGKENPSPFTGRSLARSPDGYDTSSPDDWTSTLGATHHTMGWCNSMDPSLEIETEVQPIRIEKGCITTLPVQITNLGNIDGRINISGRHDGSNWTIENLTAESVGLGVSGRAWRNITVCSPLTFTEDRVVHLEISVTWEEIDPVSYKHSIELLVPAPDVSIEDVELDLNGKKVSNAPSGSILSLCGVVRGQAELDAGNVSLKLDIFRLDHEAEGPVITSKLSFAGMTSRSKREFDIEIDTLGLKGIYRLDLAADPEDLIEEGDEQNNVWTSFLEVIPSIVLEGQLGLRISEVLWNCSQEEAYVIVENPSKSSVDITGVRISDGILYMSFPSGSVIPANSSIPVLWCKDAINRFGPVEALYCTSGVGPQHRMTVSGPLPDIYATGKVVLMTEYRVPIDNVVLKGGIGPQEGWEDDNTLEVTWGTVLYRIRSGGGVLIDTNTSMDWFVQSGHCRLKAFLPDPAVSGTGELVVLSADEDNADISGFLLMCSGRGAVIPHGTILEKDRVLVMSKDPTGYFTIHNEAPDLCFDRTTTVNKVEVQGCRVPMFQELVLPNTGGKLLLLDPRNSIIDSVTWGSGTPGSIGIPSKDAIVGRSDGLNGIGLDWMVMGTGADPILPWYSGEHLRSTIVVPESLGKGLEWVLEEGNATIITPLLDDERIVTRLADHLEGGHSIEIIYTVQPWSKMDEVEENLHPSSVRAGYAKYLQKKGAKLRVADDPLQKQGTSLVISRGRVLNVLGPMGLTWNTDVGLDIPCLGLAEDNGSWTANLDRVRLRYGTGSGGDLDGLALVEPLVPAMSEHDQPGSDPFEYSIIEDLGTGSMQLFCNIDPELEGVFINHVEGPIDMVSLLEYARAGLNVSILLGPEDLEVLGQGTLSILNRTVERILHGERLLDIGDLSENVLLRTAGLLKAAEEEDLQINARVGSVMFGHSTRGSMIIAGREVRTSLPVPSFEGGFSSISFHDANGDVGKDLIGRSWEGGGPFPWGLISTEKGLMEGRPGTIIEEVYYDTYLPDDPDEYVCIHNTRDTIIDLEGYMLTDDEGLGISSDGLVLVGNVKLLPGKDIFFTMNSSRFVHQNGDHPNIEWGSGRPLEVLSCRGTMRLANTNDTLTLRDPNGTIVDSVVWGSAELPANMWRSYEDGVWTGPSVPDAGWGKVLKRNGHIDTNTMVDWTSLRPRFPGQSRLDLFGEGNFSSLSVGVCPDSSSEVLAGVLDEARSKVLLNVYEMTSDWITSGLIGLYQRGVEVEVLLEGDPVGGISYTEEICISRMVDTGIDVRMMITDPENDIRDRYRYDHAKYLVVDDRTVFISTDNLKDTSFPPPGSQVHSGTRGWVVSMVSPELATDMTSVFREDWDGPDIQSCRCLYEVDNLQTILTVEEEYPPVLDRAWYFPISIDEAGKGEVLVSPDHISLEDNPLLEVIRSSEREIFLELMDLEIDFLSSSLNEKMIPVSHYQDHENFGVEVMNPYITELMQAAERGVKVTILLDGSDFNGDLVPDCLYKIEKLRSIFADHGVSDRISILMHPSPRYGIDGEIGMVHAKGMVVDEKWVWISSFNWGPTSGLENRELGILLRSPSAAHYLKNVMVYDLGGSLFPDMDIKRVWSRLDIDGDHGPMVETGLDVSWRGAGELVIELHLIDPQEGEATLIGSFSVNQGFEGRVILKGAENQGQEGALCLISVRNDGLCCDIETFEVRGPMLEERETAMDIWGQGWVPISLIVLFGLTISIIRAFAPRGKHEVEE